MSEDAAVTLRRHHRARPTGARGDADNRRDRSRGGLDHQGAPERRPVWASAVGAAHTRPSPRQPAADPGVGGDCGARSRRWATIAQSTGRLIANRAYSHPSTRKALQQKGIRTVIPGEERPARAAPGEGITRRAAIRVRRQTYRDCNLVEGGNRLKQWRGTATRYDKHARNYRAGSVLASILIWLR